MLSRAARAPLSTCTRRGAVRAFATTVSQAQASPAQPESAEQGRAPRSSKGYERRPNYSDKWRVQINSKIIAGEAPPHLKTLADLSPAEITKLISNAFSMKAQAKSAVPLRIRQSLYGQTIALIFNKRSTRTRVASETATKLLGGHPMFLGGQDIQLGVNETLADSAKVISSMADGFMARVGAHEEIEELAQHSRVPVVNALSDLYHPTQILADLLTLFEHYSGVTIPQELVEQSSNHAALSTFCHEHVDLTKYLKGKKIAWVGDTNNISNELLVTLPRFGAEFAIASPKGYDKVDPRVWAKVEEAQTQSLVTLTNSPAEALKDADVVVTDTWISMGQEEEKAARLKAFSGYQITNEMVNEAGAKDSWVFLHCLPRKQEEVNDEVFYGDRSLVFPEAENRKWTILSVFDAYFGRWRI